MTMSPAGAVPNVPAVAPPPSAAARSLALAVSRLMTSMVWPCFAARVCRRGALRRERWPSGGGSAFEFEVVSGRVADEHRVVVRCVLRPQPRLVEDFGAACGGEFVAESDGRLVLHPERKVGLATTGVGRQGEEQLGWLARQGVPDQVRHIEGSRAPGQADDVVVPVADGVQVVDLQDDVVEQRHGRSPVLLRPRSAAAASRSAGASSLATGWSWLAVGWGMLPGLMNLTRMSASGGMESAMERVVRGLVGGAAIRPAVGAPPTTCCWPGLPGLSDQRADDLG